MRVYVEALVGFDVPDDWTPKQIAEVLSGTETMCIGFHAKDRVTVEDVQVIPTLTHNDVMTDEHKTPCMTCGAWVPIGIDGIRAHVWGTHCDVCK